MSVADKLALRFRIETILLLNALAYLGLGCTVVLSGMYVTHNGGIVDLALSVDLLAIAAKGFLVGTALLIVNDLWG
jgi:hypothetical protein